ncbi:MAG: ThuA domain-containing protein [Eubacteriales bacterium]|nr:ThuA domain-containing protein [Eubacteriales bacterium]
MKINVTVWNEYVHERTEEAIGQVYPHGLHTAIAEGLAMDDELEIRTATLDQPEQGLPQSVLDTTDVLFWWGHKAHDQVDDELVERIARRVRDGMGIVVLHSGHYSKVFRRLMGTGCRSKWWELDDKERIFTVLPGHPIAAGIPESFTLPVEETYCEHFDIPTPDELVFLSWFSGGGVLRSGCCYHYGNGKIFYFQPGHEAYPTYYDATIRQILRNAAHWAAPNGNPPMTYGQHDRFEN